MKKVISLLLALLMTFSVVTVAFATEADPEVNETVTDTVGGTDEEAGEAEQGPIDLGEYDWILDLPFWTVGPALKFAKIALKLVNVYLKVAKIFGLVDQDLSDMIMGAIIDMIENSQNAENAEGETTTQAPEEATTPVAVLA